MTEEIEMMQTFRKLRPESLRVSDTPKALPKLSHFQPESLRVSNAPKALPKLSHNDLLLHDYIIKISRIFNQSPEVLVTYIENKLRSRGSTIEEITKYFLEKYVRCEQCSYYKTILFVTLETNTVTTGCILCGHECAHKNNSFTEYYKMHWHPIVIKK